MWHTEENGSSIAVRQTSDESMKGAIVQVSQPCGAESGRMADIPFEDFLKMTGRFIAEFRPYVLAELYLEELID